MRFELLVYEAKRRGYAEQPEIARARRNAMIQQLVKKEVDEPLAEMEITDDEVRAVYEADPTQFDRPAQVRASHILIADRTHAVEVLAKAKGTDLAGFRSLAREESEDEKTKNNGGDLHFFEADTVGQPSEAVRDAAFALDRVGAVYPELVKDRDGYHIIMLTGKRAPLKRTQEQAKRAIRHKLTQERKEAAIEALTERLRNDVKVEIDYNALDEIEIDTVEIPQNP